MKLNIIFFLLMMGGLVTNAQPRLSPDERAKRETQWMRDSLHLNEEQLGKITPMNLDYQRNMDNAVTSGNAEKIQKQLMRKKDVAFKKILDKEQFAKYLDREKTVRNAARVRYEGTHRPL